MGDVIICGCIVCSGVGALATTRPVNSSARPDILFSFGSKESCHYFEILAKYQQES